MNDISPLIYKQFVNIYDIVHCHINHRFNTYSRELKITLARDCGHLTALSYLQYLFHDFDVISYTVLKQSGLK